MTPDPKLALIIFFGLVILIWAIWKLQLLKWWNRSAEERKREWMEDILKQLYHVENSGRFASLNGLAGALRMSYKKLIGFIDILSERNLIRISDTSIKLTTEGREYALEIIRVHRLWERYLSERTGFDKSEWHMRAEYMEHKFSKEQAEILYRNLGSPRFDPHGDPIPTMTGEMIKPDWIPLSKVAPGSTVKIFHIEDEPEVVYRQILERKIRKGQLLKVTQSDEHSISFESEGNSYKLSPIISSNINVVEETDPEVENLDVRRLTSLKKGEKAKVVGLSQECRGASRRRLLDLGFTSGSQVEIGLPGPLKEPRAYLIRNTLIALRNDQADMVLIEKE
jgi:DtxR family Mn-dependent transcriptional regulator